MVRDFLGTSKIGRGMVLERAAMVGKMVIGTSCNGWGIFLGLAELVGE